MNIPIKYSWSEMFHLSFSTNLTINNHIFPLPGTGLVEKDKEATHCKLCEKEFSHCLREKGKGE